MTSVLCFHPVILSTKLAFSSFTDSQRGLQYFECRRIMSESEGPPEASKGPPEASEGPPKASEGPTYNIRDQSADTSNNLMKQI